jgi:glycosyltransferase involved in cell wall biosynthesis
MKVRILHTLPSEERTSSEVYADELSGALRRLTDDTVTITDWRPPAGGRRRGPRRYLRRYLGYQWSVRGGNGAVNHIVDHGYGHLAFSLDPQRTVVTLHDTLLLKLAAGELPGPRPRRTILGHRFSLAAIRRVAHVITDSESSRQDFLRFIDYDPARVTTIPLGISKRFQPRADPGGRPAGTNAARPLRLLHVGHCGFYKNIEGILRAIPAITRKLGRPVVLVKVGTPFTAEQRELVAQLRIGAQVEHLGAVAAEALPGVYQDAQLLLMPSWHEGFGLPVLEAMACGIPVVASDRGSLPEVVGDAGLLVDPQDMDGLAEAAVRVLSDRGLRARLRRRGLERAALFSWERTARQTLAIYRSVGEAPG